MNRNAEVAISIVGLLIGAVSLWLFLRRGAGSSPPTVIQVPSQQATSSDGVTAPPLDLSSGGDLSNLLAAILGGGGTGSGVGGGSGSVSVVQPPSGYNYGVSPDSPPPSSQLPPVSGGATSPGLITSPGLSKFAYDTAVSQLTGESMSQAAGVPGPNPAGLPASYAATSDSGSAAAVSAQAGPGGAVHPVVYTTDDPRPGGGVSPARGPAGSGKAPTYNPQVPTQGYDMAQTPAAPAPGGLSGGQAPVSGTKRGTAQAGGAGGQVTPPQPAAAPVNAPPALPAGGTAPASAPAPPGAATASAPLRSTAGRIVQGLVGTAATS